MATDWIKMRVNLADDPRVEWMATTLKCNAATVTGALYMLWARVDQHSADGVLQPYTAAKLDAYVGVEGFADALASDEVKWLEVNPKYLKVLEFDKHNGSSAKKRAQTGKRVAKHRADGNAQNVTKALPEEKREDNNTSLSTEKKGAASPPSPPITFETWKRHLPPELHTETLRAALKRWTEHRREVRAPLKPTMVESQAKRIVMLGEARAIELIDHTIEMGWKGWREPDPPRGSRDASPGRQTAQDRRTEFDKAIDGATV